MVMQRWWMEEESRVDKNGRDALALYSREARELISGAILDE